MTAVANQSNSTSHVLSNLKSGSADQSGTACDGAERHITRNGLPGHQSAWLIGKMWRCQNRAKYMNSSAPCWRIDILAEKVCNAWSSSMKYRYQSVVKHPARRGSAAQLRENNHRRQYEAKPNVAAPLCYESDDSVSPREIALQKCRNATAEAGEM